MTLSTPLASSAAASPTIASPREHPTSPATTWQLLDVALLVGLVAFGLLLRLPYLWTVPRFTDETREVAGVTTTVVRGMEGVHEFYAQDDAGNVWLLGVEGEWEAGVGEGMAGLAMPAEPRLGDGYVRGHAADGAEDLVEVIDLDAVVSVPFREFHDVLGTEVTATDRPGATGHNYYAPGVGVVRVGWAGDDPTRETLELVERVELTPEQLEEVREEALGLEQRGRMLCATELPQQMAP